MKLSFSLGVFPYFQSFQVDSISDLFGLPSFCSLTGRYSATSFFSP
jgi:hypothetical protein